MPDLAGIDALLANDKYRAQTRATYIADPADSSIQVNAIPPNLPTLLVLGWKTQYETLFKVTSTAGDNSSNYTLTGLTCLRGYGLTGNLPEGIAVNCLNNEEFFNQYGEALNEIIDDINNLDFPTGAVVGTTDAQTITNKRNQKRVDSQASTNTITPEISSYDIFIRTAQAHDLVINNHSTSTPVTGEMMLFDLLCDSTPRALTYGDQYVAYSGIDLPTTLEASKRTKLLFYRTANSKWDLIWMGQEG